MPGMATGARKGRPRRELGDVLREQGLPRIGGGFREVRRSGAAARGVCAVTRDGVVALDVQGFIDDGLALGQAVIADLDALAALLGDVDLVEFGRAERLEL